jgi:hypothetical protein
MNGLDLVRSFLGVRNDWAFALRGNARKNAIVPYAMYKVFSPELPLKPRLCESIS